MPGNHLDLPLPLHGHRHNHCHPIHLDLDKRCQHLRHRLPGCHHIPHQQCDLHRHCWTDCDRLQLPMLSHHDDCPDTWCPRHFDQCQHQHHRCANLHHCRLKPYNRHCARPNDNRDLRCINSRPDSHRHQRTLHYTRRCARHHCHHPISSCCHNPSCRCPSRRCASCRHLCWHCGPSGSHHRCSIAIHRWCCPRRRRLRSRWCSRSCCLHLVSGLIGSVSKMTLARTRWVNAYHVSHYLGYLDTPVRYMEVHNILWTHRQPRCTALPVH